MAALSRRVWDDDILPTLREYIRIPNVSVMFDPQWEAAGHMARAVELIRAWCAARPIDGMTVEVVQLPGRTPVILMEIPAAAGGGETVLLYGHLDKQPPMTGWREGLGPWEPVVEDGRLYGRGGADDGYAAFASLTAIQAVREAGGAHARCVVLIEASEESGSRDLPAYIDALAGRIGTPALIICLDSGCATYDRLWVTTSLRGILGVVLNVEILTEGVHSGAAGGVVPSSFRILRQLLSRLEDERDGEILLPELFVDIPPHRIEQAQDTAAELGASVAGHFPLVASAEPMGATPAERLLNRTWRPALATVGMDGIPPVGEGGNVLRPFTRAKLSLRLPPTCDVQRAASAVRHAVLEDPPNGAAVTCTVDHAATGWDSPPLSPWLTEAIGAASQAAFAKDARFVGEGGSIPFMGMLGERFPAAQFLVTGVLGPGSNAHGPNEFLDLRTGQCVTAAVAHVLDAHARHAVDGGDA